jgi:hypothetical protein
MKYPRNSPCPCGSGKKFKNCCGLEGARSTLPPNTDKDHFLNGPIPEAGDPPVFSKEYFMKLDPEDRICVYKLIYSNLLHPEIEQLSSGISNTILLRGRAEAKKIESCSATSDLICMMREGIDSLNIVLFRKRMLERQEEVIPLLMEEIKKPSDDGFIELAIRILGAVRGNIAEELMDIIRLRTKPVYQLSILCILLGFFDHPDVTRFLWNHYSCFRSRFPEIKYWKGPFYGLWETWARGKYGRISAAGPLPASLSTDFTLP